MTFANDSGMGLAEVLIATGILGVVALGTVQLIVNMNKQSRSIRQSNEAAGLQFTINQLLSNQDVCSLNFGTASTNPIHLNIPPASTVINRNLVDRNGAVVYIVDGATPYADRTLVIDSYTLTQTAVLQVAPPASVVGKMNILFSKTGETTGSVKLVRSINFQAKLAAGLGSPIDTCSSIGTDDILWMRNGNHILNTNPGNVGIGTSTPSNKLEVHGGNIVVSNTGTDALLAATSGVANEIIGLGWGAAGFGYIQSGTWGGATKNLVLQGGGGNVGIGTMTPGSTLQVGGTFSTHQGASSIRFADEAGASVMRLKTTNGGGVSAMIIGNGGVDYQLRVNSDNTLSLGHYPAAGDFRGFNIRGSATVNGGNYTGTIFEFGQSSGTSTARIIGAPSGSVFQGLTNAPTLIGNWDGGTVDLFSSRRVVVTGGNGGVLVGSSGGEVELLATNAIRFNSANGQIIGNAAYNQNSDERLKKNILPLENALEKILDLRGVSYDWKNPEHAKNGRQVGLIAQEVESVYPEIVVTDPSSGLKAVAYDHLVAPLIEAVKALFARLNQHSEDIEALQAENEELKTRIQVLETNQSHINKRLDLLEKK